MPNQARTPRRAVAALLALCVLVSLGLSELACRWLLPRPGYVAQGSLDQMRAAWRTDSARGYAFAPNLVRKVTQLDYQVTLATNALGLRSGPIDTTDADDPRLLAIGDSFTAGTGVEADSTWPARLQADLRQQDGRFSGVRVVNAGVPGYSLRQMRATADALIPRIRPRLLVVGLFAEAQSRLRDPFMLVDGYIVKQDEAEDVKGVSDGLLYSRMHRPWVKSLDFWLDQHFYVGAYAFKAAYAVYDWLTNLEHRPAASPEPGAHPAAGGATEYLAAIDSELTALDSLTTTGGVPMIVMLIAGQEDSGDFSASDHELNDSVAAFCARLNIPVYDPLPLLERTAAGRPIYRFRHDWHWSAAAHALAADHLAAAILERPALTRAITGGEPRAPAMPAPGDLPRLSRRPRLPQRSSPDPR
ncbi:MAG TPA: hypothetical protein VFW66_13200 [Gemmatimonadales bacterium]|nr:hypothetical protein [Gemmatimonadales bacterium]